MARAFFPFTFVLAIAAVMGLGAGATPAAAQLPPFEPSAPKAKQDREAQQEPTGGTLTLSPPSVTAIDAPEQEPTGGTLTLPSALPNAAASKTQQYPEVQEAVRLLVGPKRDMPGAIKSLQDAARRYPELPSAHVLMYQILAQLKQEAAARFQLEVAVHANPNDPEPFVLLGNIALQQQRVAEAAMDFEKAQQLLAKYANAERKAAMQQQAFSGLAAVAELGEDWKEAEARLRDLLKLTPEGLVARQRLARSLFAQGNTKDTYEVLKEAKRIDRAIAKKNKTKEIFLTPEAIMGQYYSQFEGPNSDSGNAEKWFRSAVKQAPDDLPTRQVAAVWALEKGKIPFAKEQAENALRIEAADTRLAPDERKYKGGNVGHLLRGLVALWEKDWREAEKDFQKALDNTPADFVARNNLALALVEQDDPNKKQRALDYAEANLRDHKDNPDALSTLGWIRFRRGEFDEAETALNQALKVAGGGLNNADTATYVAYLLEHQGKKWKAREIVDGLLKTDRPFSMRPEAEKLREKLKSAEAVPDADTP